MTDSHVAVITVRQSEVLHELMRDGATTRTIARRMGIGENTVKDHMREVLKAVRDAGGIASSREELIVGLFRGWLRFRVVESRRWPEWKDPKEAA